MPCMHGIGLVHMQAADFVAHGTAAARGPGLAAVVAAAAAFVVPLAIVLVIAWRWPQPGGRDDGRGDSGSGRGGPGGPPRPCPGPPRPESGPTWWPEFERQFAAYVEKERRVIRHRRKLYF